MGISGKIIEAKIIFSRSITIILLSLLMLSCDRKTSFDGEGYLNYPSMDLLWKDNVKPFQKGYYTFKLITIEGEKRDTQFIQGDKLDWKDWENPFMKADIYKKSMDRQYRLSMTEDTTNNQRTFVYFSLNPKNPTTTVNLISNTIDNNITSVYTECKIPGFFFSESYKILLVNGKSLQIQETIKKPFTKTYHRIRTLLFMQ